MIISELLNSIEREYLKRNFNEAWEKEKNQTELLLNKIINDNFSKNLVIEDCIAVAGSRIVFRVRDKESKDTFALKLCRPFPDAINMVREEYESTQDLYHPNLIRIVFKKDIQLEPEELRYPLTLEEYIPDGLNLEKWCDREASKSTDVERVTKSIRQFESYLIQICDGMYYLHENSVYHCDIKPENILINGTLAKIVDFGFAVRIASRDTSLYNKVGYSWDYAIPTLKSKVNQLVSRGMVFSYLDGEVPYIRIDQYAFGRTIEECVKKFENALEIFKNSDIKNGTARPEFYTSIKYELSYLKLIAVRLKGVEALQDDLNNKGYSTKYDDKTLLSISYLHHSTSWLEVAKDLKKLWIENLGEIAPEWETTLGSTIRIGFLDVPFTPRIRDLYNHPSMSRLANVSQLGLISYIYPSARHSRLEHSMGTYYYALRYISSLWKQKDDPFFKCIVSDSELIAASLGALFHDLGQYPHAHDIEDSLGVMVRHEQLANKLYKHKFDVEQGGTSHVLPTLYELVEKHWGNKIANLTEKYLGITGDPTRNANDHLAGILKSIISSAIDADKLDYLQRDSINLGLGYASSIETDRLIMSIRPVIRSEGESRFPKATIGISYKGLLSARSLIVAREHMFEHVYWHKTVRAFKAMLSLSLAISHEDTHKIMGNIESSVLDPTITFKDENDLHFPESLHLPYTDSSMLNLIKSNVRAPGSRHLIDMILMRRPYKPLFDLKLSEWDLVDDKQAIDSLIRKIKDIYNGKENRPQTRLSMRQKLQKVIFDQFEVVNIGNDDLDEEFGLIIDIPDLRVLSKTISLVNYKDNSIREIEPSSMLSANVQGWLSSLSPRIYINPNLTFRNKEPTKIKLISILEDVI